MCSNTTTVGMGEGDLLHIQRAHWLTQCLSPHCIWTTGWCAGPWTQRPGVCGWDPGGRRRPHWAPCLCGAGAQPEAGASSSQTHGHGGPSRPMPGSYGPPGYTAGRPQDWSVAQGLESEAEKRELERNHGRPREESIGCSQRESIIHAHMQLCTTMCKVQLCTVSISEYLGAR